MSKLLAAVLAAAWAAGPASAAPIDKPVIVAQDAAAMEASLKRADALHEELKAAIAEARKAKADSAPKTSPRAELVAALTKRLGDECLKTTPTTALLSPADFNRQPHDVVAYQACVAAEAKSPAPCEQLRALSYGTAPGTKAEGTPIQDCRAAAGGRAQIVALVSGGGGDTCPIVSPMFDKIGADKGAAVCKALLSPGEASGVCARVAAAYGPSFGAEEKKDCMSFMAVRGAKTPAACAALPKDLAGYCREAVSGRKGCADLQAKILGAHCAVSARDRVASMAAEISLQEAQMTRSSPSTAAAESLLAKRQELDGLLVQVGTALEAYQPKSDARYPRLRERFTRTRAGVDATLNAYFGRQQQKKP